eukprot:5791946-Pleurochrysis_carterae.AAC.1
MCGIQLFWAELLPSSSACIAFTAATPTLRASFSRPSTSSLSGSSRIASCHVTCLQCGGGATNAS